MRSSSARLTLVALLLVGCEEERPVPIPLPPPEIDEDSTPPSLPPAPPLERADVRVERAQIEAFEGDLREVSPAPFDAAGALRTLVQSLPPRLREGVEVAEDDSDLLVSGLPVDARASLYGSRRDDRVDFRRDLALLQLPDSVYVRERLVEVPEAGGGWELAERIAGFLDAGDRRIVVRVDRGEREHPEVLLMLYAAHAPTRGTFLRRAWVAPDPHLNGAMIRGAPAVYVELAPDHAEAAARTIQTSYPGNDRIYVTFQRRILWTSWWSGAWPERGDDAHPAVPAQHRLRRGGRSQAPVEGRVWTADQRVLLGPTTDLSTEPELHERARRLNALALLERALAAAPDAD